MTRIPFEQAEPLAKLSNVSHGFFGRRGVDTALLNVSSNFGTAGEVSANLNAACDALGDTATRLVHVRQVHSADVLAVTTPFDSDALPEADGLVTATPGLALAILTADCAPLLFADTEAGVIGACHAGWRGAVNGVAENTIRAMIALGARTTAIHAAIGPTISVPNYEVGPEFAAQVVAIDPAAKDALIYPDPNGRAHFDLPGYLAQKLTALGLASVTNAGGCTFGNPAKYFSHRHAQKCASHPGRQVAIIALNPTD